jgi:1-acyl-sn-glycerol-3-phosphate acyltransferase
LISIKDLEQMKYFLSIYIYSIVILFTVLIAPYYILYVVFFKVFFSKRVFLKRLRRFISWYGLIIVKILIFPFIKTKFTDLAKKEDIVPCIFVCNHRSSLDPYLLSFLPYEIIQIVSDWPFRIPVLGFMAKLAGYISIKEMEHDDFFKTAEKLLQQGVSLGAFPEGTRSGSNKMGQFHGAIFRVALKVKYPIVPICVTGNENIPTRDFVLYPGTVKMEKLPAIYYDQYKNMNSFKLKNYVRNIIVKETAHMENE